MMSRKFGSSDGFTLVELAIVVTVIMIIAAMAIPVYQTIVKGAQVQTAISDLDTIAKAIDLHAAQTGQLPESLADIGMDYVTDPWGAPYQYLPLETDTPVLAELTTNSRKVIVDPALVAAATEAELGGDPRAFRKAQKRKLRRLRRQRKREAKERKKAAQKGISLPPSQPIFVLQSGNPIIASTHDYFNELNVAKANLDREIRLNKLIQAGPGVPLTEEFIFFSRKKSTLAPANTDYDLNTPGPDGESEPTLNAVESRDDIVRSDNGNYFGQATGF